MLKLIRKYKEMKKLNVVAQELLSKHLQVNFPVTVVPDMHLDMVRYIDGYRQVLPYTVAGSTIATIQDGRVIRRELEEITEIRISLNGIYDIALLQAIEPEQFLQNVIQFIMFKLQANQEPSWPEMKYPVQRIG